MIVTNPEIYPVISIQQSQDVQINPRVVDLLADLREARKETQEMHQSIKQMHQCVDRIDQNLTALKSLAEENRVLTREIVDASKEIVHTYEGIFMNIVNIARRIVWFPIQQTEVRALELVDFSSNSERIENPTDNDNLSDVGRSISTVNEASIPHWQTNKIKFVAIAILIGNAFGFGAYTLANKSISTSIFLGGSMMTSLIAVMKISGKI